MTFVVPMIAYEHGNAEDLQGHRSMFEEKAPF
jgi:hypothetical protein